MRHGDGKVMEVLPRGYREVKLSTRNSTQLSRKLTAGVVVFSVGENEAAGELASMHALCSN